MNDTRLANSGYVGASRSQPWNPSDVVPPLVLTELYDPLAPLTFNAAYFSLGPNIDGGVPPYAFTDANNILNGSGLAVDPDNGTIIGTMSEVNDELLAVGSIQFKMTVTDSVGTSIFFLVVIPVNPLTDGQISWGDITATGATGIPWTTTFGYSGSESVFPLFSSSGTCAAAGQYRFAGQFRLEMGQSVDFSEGSPDFNSLGVTYQINDALEQEFFTESSLPPTRNESSIAFDVVIPLAKNDVLTFKVDMFAGSGSCTISGQGIVQRLRLTNG